MNAQVVNWRSFWPNFNLISTFDIASTDGVTALFIAIIIILLLLFIASSFGIWLCYRHRLKAYLKQIETLDMTSVINQRQALLDAEDKQFQKRSANPFFKLVKTRMGQPWREFDATLIEQDGRLYRTVDADVFFNEKTIARRIAHSRLLPTGTAILTGLGVLGTFFGLQLGLSGLSLDGDVTMIQSEIKLLAQSASVAFITSVWGVSCSLLYNFIEKCLHGLTMRKIDQIQAEIDKLFPQFQIVAVFTDIKQSGRNASDTLGGLAEEIGLRMQTSMDSFSTNMAESIAKNISDAANNISSTIGVTLKQTIEDSLVPSITSMAEVSKELADRQAEGSQNAMKILLEQFMTAMGKEGDGQREAMRSAAEEIRKTMGEMGTSMNEFFNALHEQQEDINKIQDERAKVLEQTVRDLVAYQGQAQEETQRKMAEMLETFAAALGQEQTRQADSLSSASGDMREAIGELGKGLQDFFDELGSKQQAMAAEQDERTRALETTVQRMINSQSEANNNTNSRIAEMLYGFLEHIDETQQRQAGSLGQASDGIREALSDVGGSMETFIKELNTAQSRLRDEQDDRHKTLQQLVQDSQSTAASLLEQGQILQHQVDNGQKAMDSVVARLNKAGEAMAQATENLRTLGNEIGRSVNNASTSIGKSIELAEQLFTENALVAKGLDNSLRGMKETEDVLKNLSHTLTEAALKSGQDFKEVAQHYRELQQTMKSHVEDLDEQMTKLLSDYATNVQGQIDQRMREWNKQTNEFCTNMVNAVQAIGDIVENIENQDSSLRIR